MKLLGSLKIVQYKTKHQIIDEKMDLEGHGTFKIFKQYFKTSVDDEPSVQIRPIVFKW